MPELPNSVVCLRGIPLDHIKGFNASPQNGEVTTERTLTPKREATGFRSGQKPDYALSWTFTEMPGGGFEVDYEQLYEDGEEFDMSRDTDARTQLWPVVRISTITEDTDDNTGVTEYNVSAVALKKRRM